MKDQLVQLSYTVELGPGEKLTLPAAFEKTIGPGRWILTLRPSPSPAPATRCHDAFLNGYAPEDEGVYDDLAR